MKSRPALSRSAWLAARPLLLGLTLGLGMGLVPQTAPTARADLPQLRKVAVVDMQQVLNTTKQGKRAREDLETSSKAKQEKIDRRRTKLEQDSAKLKDLSEKELGPAQERLQKELGELQSMVYALQSELGQQESQLLEKIYTNSAAIVSKLASELGIDLVLVRDQTTVIYAQESLDLTAQVIQRYDQAHR